MDKDKPPSHFCALVVMRIADLGKVECLAINYRKASGSIQVKWAGGNSDEGETPFVDMVATLRREIREELGVEISLVDSDLKKRVIFEKGLSPTHRQYFFIVSHNEISGQLRKVPGDDKDEVLSPPYWIEAGALFRKIFNSHVPALIKALEIICLNDDLSMKRYEKLLREYAAKGRY